MPEQLRVRPVPGALRVETLIVLLLCPGWKTHRLRKVWDRRGTAEGLQVRGVVLGVKLPKCNPGGEERGSR